MTVRGSIYLVRHGETEWNAQGRFQGRLDSPLTPTGREQARRVGRLISAAIPPGAPVRMHVSPLGRTRRTAEIIQWFGRYPEPVLEPRLREVTMGSWDGLTQVDIEAGWPGLLDGSTRHDWYFRAPDGEGYETALARVDAWLGRIEGTVVAVSHGLLGRLIRGAYLGLPRAEALRLPVPQDVVWHFGDGDVRAVGG